MSIGLFCVSVGLFCVLIESLPMGRGHAPHFQRCGALVGLFCVSIGLFCVSVGLFCVLIESLPMGREGHARHLQRCGAIIRCVHRSLLCVVRSLLRV